VRPDSPEQRVRKPVRANRNVRVSRATRPGCPIFLPACVFSPRRGSQVRNSHRCFSSSTNAEVQVDPQLLHKTPGKMKNRNGSNGHRNTSSNDQWDSYTIPFRGCSSHRRRSHDRLGSCHVCDSRTVENPDTNIHNYELHRLRDYPREQQRGCHTNTGRNTFGVYQFCPVPSQSPTCRISGQVDSGCQTPKRSHDEGIHRSESGQAASGHPGPLKPFHRYSDTSTRHAVDHYGHDVIPEAVRTFVPLCF
jgi:hypothetical protein